MTKLSFNNQHTLLHAFDFQAKDSKSICSFQDKNFKTSMCVKLHVLVERQISTHHTILKTKNLGSYFVQMCCLSIHIKKKLHLLSV